MWTRGSKANGFQVEVFDEDGNLTERKAGFETAAEADKFGEEAQRRILFPTGEITMPQISDEDLLQALGV